RHWLAHKAIESGSCDPLFGQRCEECVLVHDTAACCVDQIGNGFHRPNLLVADEAASFEGQWTMNRNEIRLAHQLIERYFPAAGGAYLLVGQEWIEHQGRIHAKPGEKFLQCPADSAKADDAERPIAQLAPHVVGTFVPASFLHQPI